MSETPQTTWYHNHRYNAQAPCQHCSGIIRHEDWCITRDPVLYYAHEIVADPTKLTIGDALILHSLGVTWDAKPYLARCTASHP
jgi:hypothetical protein